MTLATPEVLGDLAHAVMRGERHAVARAITLVERDGADSVELLRRLQRRSPAAYRIGVTGPPGAGKSTLVGRLAGCFRARGDSVAIVAVDPSSPFSSGALLGDRIRMAGVWDDDAVFIRSMAARAAIGGLAAKTIDVADVLDAAGFDVIVIETVGVGQGELDVAQAADTTVVVLTPESGDEIQAAKAGLMEIADVFVVNKCDRPGSEAAVASIRAMLNLRRRDQPPGEWLAELVRATATSGKGIDETITAIDAHRRHQEAGPRLRRRRVERARRRVLELCGARACHELAALLAEPVFAARVEQIADGLESPHRLAAELWTEVRR